MFWKQRSLIPEVWRVGSFGLYRLNHVCPDSDSEDKSLTEALEEGSIRSKVLIYIVSSGVGLILNCGTFSGFSSTVCKRSARVNKPSRGGRNQL